MRVRTTRFDGAEQYWPRGISARVVLALATKHSSSRRRWRWLWPGARGLCDSCRGGWLVGAGRRGPADSGWLDICPATWASPSSTLPFGRRRQRDPSPREIGTELPIVRRTPLTRPLCGRSCSDKTAKIAKAVNAANTISTIPGHPTGKRTTKPRQPPPETPSRHAIFSFATHLAPRYNPQQPG